MIKSAVEDFIVSTVETRLGYNQDAEYCSPPGVEVIPLKDDRVLLSQIDGSGKWLGHSVLTVPKGAEPGDVWIYSRDSDGEVVSFIKLLADGKIEVEVADESNVTLKGKASLTIEDESEITLKKKVSVTTEDDAEITLKKNGNVTVSGDAKIDVSGNCEVSGKTVKVSGEVTVTGGSCTIGGVVAPTGQGALCGIPFCAFTGAPQCGTKSQGT